MRLVCQVCADRVLMNVGAVIVVVCDVFDAATVVTTFPDIQLFRRNEKPPLIYCMAFSSEMSGAGVSKRCV